VENSVIDRYSLEKVGKKSKTMRVVYREGEEKKDQVEEGTRRVD